MPIRLLEVNTPHGTESMPTCLITFSDYRKRGSYKTAILSSPPCSYLRQDLRSQLPQSPPVLSIGVSDLESLLCLAWQRSRSTSYSSFINVSLRFSRNAAAASQYCYPRSGSWWNLGILARIDGQEERRFDIFPQYSCRTSLLIIMMSKMINEEERNCSACFVVGFFLHVDLVLYSR